MNPIKQLRSRLGVTQTAMAAAIGVSQANVSLYESGQQMPPQVAQRLITYAYELGQVVTYEDIYGAPPVPRQRRAGDRKSAESS